MVRYPWMIDNLIQNSVNNLYCVILHSDSEQWFICTTWLSLLYLFRSVFELYTDLRINKPCEKILLSRILPSAAEKTNKRGAINFVRQNCSEFRFPTSRTQSERRKLLSLTPFLRNSFPITAPAPKRRPVPSFGTLVYTTLWRSKDPALFRQIWRGKPLMQDGLEGVRKSFRNCLL